MNFCSLKKLKLLIYCAIFYAVSESNFRFISACQIFEIFQYFNISIYFYFSFIKVKFYVSIIVFYYSMSILYVLFYVSCIKRKIIQCTRTYVSRLSTDFNFLECFEFNFSILIEYLSYSMC